MRWTKHDRNVIAQTWIEQKMGKFIITLLGIAPGLIVTMKTKWIILWVRSARITEGERTEVKMVTKKTKRLDNCKFETKPLPRTTQLWHPLKLVSFLTLCSTSWKLWISLIVISWLLTRLGPTSASRYLNSIELPKTTPRDLLSMLSILTMTRMKSDKTNLNSYKNCI